MKVLMRKKSMTNNNFEIDDNDDSTDNVNSSNDNPQMRSVAEHWITELLHSAVAGFGE